MFGTDWLARILAYLRAYWDTRHGHHSESAQNLPTELSESCERENKPLRIRTPRSTQCEETVLDSEYLESLKAAETLRTKSGYAGIAKQERSPYS